jgi:hypothetical protein
MISHSQFSLTKFSGEIKTGVTFCGSSSAFVLTNRRQLVLKHLKGDEENVLVVGEEDFQSVNRFLNVTS